MKFLRSFVLAAAAFFAVHPAAAQWQTPRYSVPLGNGGAVTGFSFATPGIAGGVLTSNGPSSFPSFQPVVALAPPQGYLSLVAGASSSTSDIIGASNIYYGPVGGTGIGAPIYNGVSMTMYPFTSSATDNTGLILALGGSATWPQNSIFDVFFTLNAGVPVLATRMWDASMLPPAPALITPSTSASSSGSAGYIVTGTTPTAWTTPANAFNGTVHQTSANSATVAAPSNTGLANCLGQSWGNGQAKVLSQVIITSPTDNPLRGDASGNLNVNVYGSDDNASWFRIDQHFIQDAANTSFVIPVNVEYTAPHQYNLVCVSGNNSNAIRVSQIQFYSTAAPLTRRLVPYNGVLVNDAATSSTQICSNASCGSTISGSIPQYQGTYLGAFQTDAASNGRVTAHATAGPSRVYNISNAYNQKTITLQATIISNLLPGGAVTDSNNYKITSTLWNPCQSSAYSMTVLNGYPYEPLTVSMQRLFYMNGSVSGGIGYNAGIAVDNILTPSGKIVSSTTDTANISQGQGGSAFVVLPPYAGSHTFTCVEQLAYPLAAGVSLSVFTNILNNGMVASWRG